MVSNQDLIKAVFDDDVMKRNKWFFTADWEKAEIENLETKNDWLRVKYIIWYNGTWKNGIWDNGTWENDTWKNGIWERGIWYNGTWKKGVWENGLWEKGTWEKGTWKKGTWKSGEWIKGEIWDSKTKKYIESTVPPNKCKWSLSYDK